MYGKSFNELMEMAYGVRIVAPEDVGKPLPAKVLQVPWQPARWWFPTVSHILLTLAFIELQLDFAIYHYFADAQFVLDLFLLILLPSALVALLLAKFLLKKGFSWYHLFSAIVFVYLSVGMTYAAYITISGGG